MFNTINEVKKKIDLIHSEQASFYSGYIDSERWFKNANEIDNLVKKLDKFEKAAKMGIYVVGEVHNGI